MRPGNPRGRVFRASLALTILAAAAVSIPAVSAAPDSVQFATFNASLNRGAAGQALADLSAPGNAQADAVAEIIQRTRPEVLLINEFDFYAPTVAAPDGPLVEAFRDNYLEVAHGDAAPIEYPYAFVAPSNTGISSGFDLNNNGVIDTTPGDNPLRRRLAGVRRVPRPVRHGRVFAAPDPRRRCPHVPALPVEGHARRPAAGRSDHGRAP